jgi:hypothetical protein
VFRSRALVWPSPQKLCEGGIFWEENKKEKRIRRKKIWGQTAAANCRNLLTSRARERNLSSTSSIELAHESWHLTIFFAPLSIDRRILYLWDILLITTGVKTFDFLGSAEHDPIEFEVASETIGP